jgi:hypothetical protein
MYVIPIALNMYGYAHAEEVVVSIGSGDADHQQNIWLGDWCDEVRKVTLHQGDTM